jgi:succinate dehydrogenase flavin-adding protein (antitoxin of CptAB toxin-antitoxin module)
MMAWPLTNGNKILIYLNQIVADPRFFATESKKTQMQQMLTRKCIKNSTNGVGCLMEISNPLVQLSLLESLKANKISDEIDLFLPFIAVTLSNLGILEITPEIVQDELSKSFGFKPPISAVKVFITRAKKRQLLHKKNHAFIPNIKVVNLWQNDYHQKKNDIESSLKLLRSEFIEFAQKTFNKELSPTECDTLIEEFIHKNIASASDAKVFEKNQLHNKLKNTDHVTASFLNHIHKNKTSSLEHFSQIVKGRLLANYLCLADKIGTKSNYSNLTVYLDTPIIVGLLGFSEPQKQNSLKEFVNLLKNVGINLYIFDKTLDEIQQLLSAWKEDLAQNNYQRFKTKTLEVLRHKNYSPARLDTEIKLLESSLKDMGIAIKYGFKLNQRFQCDEIALENAISKNFKESKDLVHDTVCISRIYNMRQGNLISNLNQSFAVFVTLNTGLMEAANYFFEEQIPKQKVPLIVSEQWMTTMFWLKKPELFETLPTEQIISSAYALLYTDDQFWKSFITKLEQLEKNHKITEENFILVRWDKDLLAMVHNMSVDVGTHFSNENVFDIVEAIKQKNSQIQDQERSQFQSIIDAKDSQLNAIKLGTEKMTNIISILVSVLLCAILGISALWVEFLLFPKEFLPKYISSEYQTVSKFSSMLIILFLISNFFSLFGVDLIKIYSYCRNIIYQKTLNILNRALYK